MHRMTMTVAPAKRQLRGITELCVVAALLCFAAWYAPIPLYVMTLSLFGLPHVLWELAWIKQVYSHLASPRIWGTFFAALAVLVVGRTGLLFNWLSPAQTLALDGVSLLLLFACLGFCATAIQAKRARAVFVLSHIAVVTLLAWALYTGMWLWLVMILAVTHHFTPAGLVPNTQQFKGVSTAWVLRGLFTLPLVMLLLPPSPQASLGIAYMPPEAAWLQGELPALLRNALAAFVLSQCLHYYAVLRVMPTSLGKQWQSLPRLKWMLAICAALFAWFMTDFYTAKAAYAVAAGVHAWLEWPVLMLLVFGRFFNQKE